VCVCIICYARVAYMLLRYVYEVVYKFRGNAD